MQYDAFEWQFYRFQNFEVYFYTGGKELAVHTAKFVHQKIPKIEKFLDFYNQERLQFIVYNKQSHFQQSNIGLSTNEAFNIGGVTNIVGNKVFIYFEGDYVSFDRQIEAGIYKVMIYQLLYGGNWRQVLRNSALLHLPEWYIDGLISYLTNSNSPLIESKIKAGITSNKFKRFNALSSQDAYVAGHSMWSYVAATYGQNVVSNIIYMTRVSRNIDDGFLYALGISFEDLYKDWLQYYQTRYKTIEENSQLKQGEKIEIKTRKQKLYANYSLSPDGRFITFTENKLGKIKLFLYDRTNKKKEKIYSTGNKLERIQDYSYPIIAWTPNSKAFSFITEKKGDLIFHTYSLSQEELYAKNIFKLEKVLGFDYINTKEIVFSAVANGQSDLYLYNVVGNTQKQLTNDLYDDTQPHYDQRSHSIVFTSNRQNDSLNLPHQVSSFQKENDIFIYRLNEEDKPILSVTDSDELNEIEAKVMDSQLYYSANKRGKVHFYMADFDSLITHIDTTIHYDYYFNSKELGTTPINVLEYSGSINDPEVSELIYRKDRYHLNINSLNEWKVLVDSSDTKGTDRAGSYTPKIIEGAKRLKAFETRLFSKEVNINDYEFIGETDTDQNLSKTSQITPMDEEFDIDLKFPTQRIYRLNFKPDNSILQLNNAFINGQYQIFNGGPFTNPGLGVNSKIGIVDLMEDHRIYGGFRLSGDITEYSLNYQNLKKRLDKEYSFTRRKERLSGDFSAFDIKTLQATVSLKWPFNEVASLRGAFLARNDKIIPLATDRAALELNILNEYWTSAKLAYVFDNTRNVSMNIRYGTRYKVFAEQYQLIYAEDPNTSSSDLSVFGFDFRHYQKLHKEIIYVGRVAGSKSLGSNPLIYYLGGVDEWWKSDLFDNNTPIDPTQNYGFQALAANMRGFLQNVRNGNNFVVINQEIRIPLFTYLINRPIQSDFVRNFQIVGFGDIGTAWVGDSPFDNENPFNDAVTVIGPITVTYEDINDPIVGGFGGGLRTTLLGYFVRADWGWGVENGVISDKPLFMFSLSLDI